MSVVEDIPYPSKVEKILELIQNYIKATKCKYCNSEDLEFHLQDYYLICNNCGKHQVLNHRFGYLEEKNQEITIEKVYNTIINALEMYYPENRTEGNYYYCIKLIIEKVKEKLDLM